MTAASHTGPREATVAAPRRGRPGHDLDAVVAAGTAVFTGRGYHAATMDDVADALGIKKSSLYHHVSSKEEILRRALDRALDALEAVFDEEYLSDPSPGARLEHAVRRSVETLIAELPSVTLLLRVRGNSEVEQAAIARRRALDARLANLVMRAQAGGSIRADLDPHLVARLVFGTVNSLAEWYRPRPGADGTGAGAEGLADAVCATVFGGLRSRL